MIVLPQQSRTIGDVLPVISSPFWRREELTSRLREEFWRGFWWAAWLGMVLGAWAGWFLAQTPP